MGDESEVKEETTKPEKEKKTTQKGGKKMPGKRTDAEGNEFRSVLIPSESVNDLRRIKAHLELENGEAYSMARAAEYTIKETLERLEE